MKRSTLAGCLPLLAVILCAGCRFLPGEVELRVAVPPLPAELAGHSEDDVVLKLLTSAGERQTARLPAGGRTTLRVQRAALTALTAEFADGVPPAGAVLPVDGGDAGEVRLSFEAGAAALILARLAEAGVPVECIDYGRLRREMLMKSAGNPCRLDLDRIYGALLSGRFSALDIRLLPEYQLPAGSLPAGEWRPANPLAPLLQAERVETVCEGRHILYGGGEEVTLWCLEEGWRVYGASGVRAGGW